MKIVSWNVNGLKRLRPLKDLFKTLDADIICFQEVRASGLNDPDLESLAFVPGYNSYFSICTTKRGYSGVATFCRDRVATPLSASDQLCNEKLAVKVQKQEGQVELFSTEQFKDEGRCMIAEHDHFLLINIYVPAVSVEGREVFKMAFLKAVQRKIESILVSGKYVIVAGDFNICPSVNDRAGPILYSSEAEWEQSPSRKWLHRLLRDNGQGLVDSYRKLHPNITNAYTCWSERTRARETNYGVRIDLILVDQKLFHESVISAEIHSEILGSDHCPISLTLQFPTYEMAIGRKPAPLCTKYLARFSKRQSKIGTFLSQTQSKPKVTPLDSGLGKRPRSPVRKDASQTNVFKGKYQKMVRNNSRECFSQSSIRNFFGAKQSPIAKVNIPDRDETPNVETGSQTNSLFSNSTASITPRNEQKADVAKKRKETAEAWKLLLSGPRPPPYCKHGKPCIRKTVSKPGKNKGKTFFSCSLPEGIGKNTRCNFFKWA